MGYRISYENGCRKSTFSDKEKIVRKKRIIKATFISLLIAFFFLLQNAEFRKTILPGNGAVTEAAIKNLVDSIQNGTQVGDALAAFCQDIVKHAE